MNEPRAALVTAINSTQASSIGKLPVEVRDMVFLVSHPRDLVSCMYAYEDLRWYLSASETSRTNLWQAIFAKQVGESLPLFPKYLAAGQFAEFVFGNRCMTCQREHSNPRTHYTLLTRHCPTCYPDQLVSAEWVMRNLVGPGERFTPKMLPSDEFRPYPGQPQPGIRYSLFLAKTVTQAYRARFKIEPAVNIPGKTRERYLNKVKSHVHEIEKIGRQVQSYITGLENYTQLTRYQNILTRLKREPEKWTPEDFPRDHIKWKRWMSYEGNLTDKAWRDLYPCLRPALEKERAEKIHLVHRKKVLLDLYQEFKQGRRDLFFPKSHYLFSVKPLSLIWAMDVGGDLEIRAQWQRHLSDLETSLQAMTDDLMNEVKTWYRACLVACRASNPDSIIEIASFKCGQCHIALGLESFYLHKHFVGSFSEALMQANDPRSLNVSQGDGIGFPRGPGMLYFDKDSTAWNQGRFDVTSNVIEPT